MSDIQGSETRTGNRDSPSVLGRLLFGGMLAVAAINSFRGLEGQIAYAESKGVKYANYLVPFSSGMLAFGSVGIIFWRFPRLATGAIITFFAAVTPTMHDFWNMAGQEKQNELNHFIKNSAMLGAALAFFGRASRQ